MAFGKYISSKDIVLSFVIPVVHGRKLPDDIFKREDKIQYSVLNALKSIHTFKNSDKMTTNLTFPDLTFF